MGGGGQEVDYPFRPQKAVGLKLIPLELTSLIIDPYNSKYQTKNGMQSNDEKLKIVTLIVIVFNKGKIAPLLIMY